MPQLLCSYLRESPFLSFLSFGGNDIQYHARTETTRKGRNEIESVKMKMKGESDRERHTHYHHHQLKFGFKRGNRES